MKHYFCLISFLFFSVLLNSFEPSSQERWQQISHDVDSWVDALGYPIDAKIKEIVIALNALDIPTQASCEGHLDHGLPYPWVELGIQIPEKISEFQKTLEKIQEEEKLLEIKFPELSRAERLEQAEGQSLILLYDKENELSNKIEIEKKKSLKALYILLEEFYKTQNSPYDCVLFLDQSIYQVLRLQSLGADLQLIRSEEEKEKKLLEYQKEMENFSRFLKNYFSKIGLLPN